MKSTKRQRLTSGGQQRVYEAFIASMADLPRADDPENEYQDNVVVLEQSDADKGHVRLLYSAKGQRFEVDELLEPGCYLRKRLILIQDRQYSLAVIGEVFGEACELFGLFATRDKALVEQYLAAQCIYSMVLHAHDLADNGLCRDCYW